MKNRSSVRFAIAMSVLAAVGWLNPDAALAQPKGQEDEAENLHVLLVIDTLSSPPTIGKACAVDRDGMKGLLEAGFAKHKGRLHITILDDKECTTDAVNAYYRKLKVGPRDALLFFFSGHGGFDQYTYGNFFNVRDGKLWRSDVRQWMVSKGSRLSVILSDACNNFARKPVEYREVKTAPDWDTIRSLFLAPRGVVDIAAVSEGEHAFCEEKVGGFFASAVTNTVRTPFKQLDQDGDKFLHWHEILPSVQEGAQQSYAEMRKKDLADTNLSARYREDLEKQTHHTLRVYSLPPVLRFGARVVSNQGDGLKIALVHEFTPAALAGLKSGDIILKIGDKSLKTTTDFEQAIAAAERSARFRVQRVNSTNIVEIEVRLAPWPAVVGRDR